VTLPGTERSGGQENTRGDRAWRVARAEEVTQTLVAERLKKTQATISSIESRKDWHLSTLVEYVEALGGELDIRAVFPDKTIPLRHFATMPRKAALR